MMSMGFVFEIAQLHFFWEDLFVPSLVKIIINCYNLVVLIMNIYNHYKLCSTQLIFVYLNNTVGLLLPLVFECWM